MADNLQEDPAVRYEAACLIDQMNKLEFCIMTVLWSDILFKINTVSIALQQETIDLSTLTWLLETLLIELQQARDNFNFYEEEGKRLAEIKEYEDFHFQNKNKKFPTSIF